MQATNTLDLHAALNTRIAVPPAHAPAADNVIAALVEALSSGEHYELVERDGELFVQPVAFARPARATQPTFSPDARAHREAFAIAA
jgi:hypothetical protein